MTRPAGGAPGPEGAVRRARESDAEAIARIYNQGIEDRVATFETEQRSVEEVRGWFEGSHPIAVAEEAGAVVAFAASSPFRSRACYAGVAELSVYVERERRGRGSGRRATGLLLRECEAAGFWKMIAGVFAGNEASLRLMRATGFREIGVYQKHARLDGAWRDVALFERLLGAAARDAGEYTPAMP
ncbi:MAG: arsinothricin resistance N-acetyltransferase ArsN1 [Myxococcales bacterium]